MARAAAPTADSAWPSSPIQPSSFRAWPSAGTSSPPAALALDLDAVRAAAADTLVARYWAESAEINLGKGPQKGFVGTVAYELPTNPVPARLLALLADAALFLGVGMKTARGMGLCRRTRDEQ